MMKAVVKAKPEPGLWLEEVPVPTVRGDDVLIRVLKASICGTDVHIYNWDAWAQKTIPVPMTIGHEFVGAVDAVGDHVKGFAREIEAIRVHVRDHDVPRAGSFANRNGHATDGSCSGDEHIFPDQIKRERSVNRIPQRIETGKHIERN